jgi:hypothetical protein
MLSSQKYQVVEKANIRQITPAREPEPVAA